MEVKHSSEAIQILSPSTAMPCSLRGTNMEALHNPTVGTSIISEFLAKNLLGNMPLVSTNKLFKSLLGLFFECCGIARVVLVIIDKIEVFIDFHIYAILEFNLLIGYPLYKLFQEKPSDCCLDEKFGKTASAIPIFHLEIPIAKHNPNQDLVEEVKFISSFISHPCEAEHPSSPFPELEPCPFSQHDITLEK